MLVRVVASHFVAGFVTDETGRCVEAAPILKRHLLGKSRDDIREIVRRRGWKASIVPEVCVGGRVGNCGRL